MRRVENDRRRVSSTPIVSIARGPRNAARRLYATIRETGVTTPGQNPDKTSPAKMKFSLVTCAFFHVARSIGPDTERRIEEGPAKRERKRMPLGSETAREAKERKKERDGGERKGNARGAGYSFRLSIRGRTLVAPGTRSSVICGRCSAPPMPIDLHLQQLRVPPRAPACVPSEIPSAGCTRARYRSRSEKELIPDGKNFALCHRIG